jgi:PIN domain nuclease of toxin-antitoxin system
MNLLIDTLSFLWFTWLDAKLSATAHALMADPNNKLYFSPASFWEMAIKVSLKKLDLGEPYDVFVPREVGKLNLVILPIEIRHAGVLVTLPYHHKDPFDRMLIAQASVEAMPIVSADNVFDLYPVTRLW